MDLMTQGPCLQHCYCSKKVLVFSHLALGYTISCILYLLLTRKIGTPFADSLTEDQQEIKQKSSMKRMNIFLKSMILSAIILAIWKPFKKP